MALYFLSNYIYDDLGNSTNSVLQFPIVKSGTSYGYKTSKTGTFVAFRGDSTDTYTYVSGSTGGTVDLGARNNYRYINASNVYNKGKSDGVTTHTGTYTFPSNDTGGTKDLGVNHSYRYVNASNVYNKGVSDVVPRGFQRVYWYRGNNACNGKSLDATTVVTCSGATGNYKAFVVAGYNSLAYSINFNNNTISKTWEGGSYTGRGSISISGKNITFTNCNGEFLASGIVAIGQFDNYLDYGNFSTLTTTTGFTYNGSSQTGKAVIFIGSSYEQAIFEIDFDNKVTYCMDRLGSYSGRLICDINSSKLVTVKTSIYTINDGGYVIVK